MYASVPVFMSYSASGVSHSVHALPSDTGEAMTLHNLYLPIESLCFQRHVRMLRTTDQVDVDLRDLLPLPTDWSSYQMRAGTAGTCTLLPVMWGGRGQSQGKGKGSSGTKGGKGTGSGKGAASASTGRSDTSDGRSTTDPGRYCDEPASGAAAGRPERPRLATCFTCSNPHVHVCHGSYVLGWFYSLSSGVAVIGSQPCGRTEGWHYFVSGLGSASPY